MPLLQRIKWRIALVVAIGLPLCLIGLSYAQGPGMPGGIPRPPGMPRGPLGPGGGLGPGGPGAPGGAGGNVWEFKCSKCGAVLGTGRTPLDRPNYSSCPKCGARFVNGGGFNPSQPPSNGPAPNNPAPNNPTPPPAGGPPPGMNPGPGQNPGIPGGDPGFNPGRPAPNDPGFNPGPAQTPPPRSETSSSSSSTTPATTGTSRVSWVLLIVFVGGGLFLLLAIAGVAGVIWMISTAPRGATGAPRSRKRSRSEYEPI